MSRLQALHVPFSAGRDDTVDDRVLPDGVFDELSNGRLTRAGELRLRGGWRPVSTKTLGEGGEDHGTATIAELYATSTGVVARTTANQLQALTLGPDAAYPWVRGPSPGLPPVAEADLVVGGVEDLSGEILTASCAVAGGFGATCVQDAEAFVLRVFRLSTDETLLYVTADDTTLRKVIGVGDELMLVSASSTNITLSTLDPTDDAPAFATVETVTANVTAFDAVATPSGVVHLVYVVSGAATYRQFQAGDEVGSGKTVVASGAEHVWIAADADGDNVHVAYQDSADQEVHLLTFSADSPFTTVDGPTTLDATIDERRVAIAADADNVYIAAQTDVDLEIFELPVDDHDSETSTVLTGAFLATGWLVAPDGRMAIGLAPTDSDGVPETPRDVYFSNLSGPWFVAAYGLGAVSSTGYPWSPGQDGDTFLAPWPRISNATPAQSRARGEGATRQVGVIGGAFAGAGRPGTEFAGALYVSGGSVAHVARGLAVESGLLPPVIDTITVTPAEGGLLAGTYRYRAVTVWTDRAGQVHRSPPSAPAEATPTEASAIGVAVRLPRTLRLSESSLAGQLPTIELYRTEAGGELFYVVAAKRPDDTEDDSVGFIDTIEDSLELLDNRRIYTEGEFGAVSGALAITSPNPSRLIAPLRDRLMVAGGNTVQVSQIAIPGEPAAFTQPGLSGTPALGYLLPTDGRITMLASLDQTILVGTSQALYVSSADGGPNLAGQGEFPSLARLPSDVGAAGQAAVVEDAAGLWFLAEPADAGRLYVLPRGQGAPVAGGLPVRDIVAAGTVSGAAVSAHDDLTLWTVGSKAVARHAQSPNPWVVDGLPFTAAGVVPYDGGLLAVDTSGGVWHYDPDTYGDGTSGGTAVALQVTTGDVQPFGLAGHGRLAVIEALVEHVSNATLKAEISYDFGATWTDLGSFTVTADGPVQWRPARQRGGKFRLRLTMTPSSTTAEGCRLTGFSLYYRPASGPSRLASANRK